MALGESRAVYRSITFSGICCWLAPGHPRSARKPRTDRAATEAAGGRDGIEEARAADVRGGATREDPRGRADARGEWGGRQAWSPAELRQPMGRGSRCEAWRDDEGVARRVEGRDG